VAFSTKSSDGRTEPRSGQPLTLDAAVDVLNAARAKATQIDVPMNIAVVDNGGNLGIPLLSGSRVMGAIGVSGGSVEQDQEVAEAGVAAFSA
jgi:uncharacterized protein GlcG (DUF336 family)